MIKLEDCVEITPEKYLEFPSPVFKGQTTLDSKGYYWMVFESNGVLYKIHNKL
jgi:hypothetical protein